MAMIVDVASVEEAALKVVVVGGEIREARRALSGMGYLVMCRDSEGHTFGVIQLDETAG